MTEDRDEDMDTLRAEVMRLRPLLTGEKLTGDHVQAIQERDRAVALLRRCLEREQRTFENVRKFDLPITTSDLHHLNDLEGFFEGYDKEKRT